MTDVQQEREDESAGANRKAVAAWITIGLLAIAVLFAAWLAILADAGRFVDDPNRDEPRLLRPWATALWFMKRGEGLTAMFGTLGAIITVGIGWVADLYKRKAQIAVLALLSLVGVGACVAAMVALDSDAKLSELVYHGNLDSIDTASSVSTWFFGALIGWFVSFLAAQLGLSSLQSKSSSRRAGAKQEEEGRGLAKGDLA